MRMREKTISSLWIEAYPESSVAYSKRIRLAEQRINEVVTLLTKEYGIPKTRIETTIGKKAIKEPTVKVMLMSPQSKPYQDAASH